MACLTWLHVSDWHQAGVDFDREVVRDALLADVRQRVERLSPALGRIDFIVLSGDLANRGKPEEYGAAKDHLLDPLREAAGVAPEHLFLVPGNHDLDWDLFELLPCALTKPLKNSSDVNHWLTDPKRWDRLVDPFAAYSNFATTYCGADRSVKGYVSSFEAAGRKIAVVGLNSALMAGRMRRRGEADDRANLVLGEPQVYRTLGEAAGADVLLAVLHHPFEWLAEFDRIKNQQDICSACHFVLCGHQHRPGGRATKGTEGSYVCIPAGACYSRAPVGETPYWHSYNFVHLDLDRGTGLVYFRRWSEPRRKWLQDHDAGGAGRWTFRLPKDLAPRRMVSRPPRARRNAPTRAAAAERSAIVRVRDRDYVFIPRGPFTMGSSSERVEELVRETKNQQFHNERPDHPVQLGPFYIGRYPVTNAEYAEFVRAKDYALRSHDDNLSRRLRWDPGKRSYPEGLAYHPVVLVSWFDAWEYCRWLGGRLPTEAEWEKAARGGEKLEWPWGNDWAEGCCNSWEARLHATTPVGCFSPRGDSPWGVGDMAGNVAEWCSSLELPYPYRCDDGREVHEAPGRRVIRGGAFTLDRRAARCVFRHSVEPGDYGPTIGFRVVLERLPR